MSGKGGKIKKIDETEFTQLGREILEYNLSRIRVGMYVTISLIFIGIVSLLITPNIENEFIQPFCCIAGFTFSITPIALGLSLFDELTEIQKAPKCYVRKKLETIRGNNEKS